MLTDNERRLLVDAGEHIGHVPSNPTDKEVQIAAAKSLCSIAKILLVMAGKNANE